MFRRYRIVSLLCAFTIVSSVVGASPFAASAQTQAAAALRGRLVDQAGGVPIPNADVTLYQGDKRIAITKTQADGTFTFPAEPSGIYYAQIRAQGYQGVRSDNITVVAGATATDFRAALTRVSTNSGGLREIGRVSASSGRSSISTSTTISQAITTDLIQKQGYNRIGDSLNTLPGVNTTGESSSIGDDQGIDIRGYGSDETETLIDGHPIGPQGPGSGGFSGQVSPSFAIGETRVTYGSGALGLYGTDSVGGTIDQQTLNPTRTPHAALTQGFGNFGKSLTNFQATGTIGKVGYAIVHAVQGTYGPFAPAQRPQTGLSGIDLSLANLANNTYTTSQNYLLRNDLLKLRYQIDDKTNLTVSGLSATSWDDKSGNGDNCYLTYQLQLYRGQNLASGANTYPSQPVPGQAVLTCNGSVAVNTNNGPACVTPAQYAAGSSGLAGGGAGPWQSHRVQDYHARLTRQFGENLVSFDAFTNRYTTDYNRNVSGGLDPSGTFFTGGFDTDFYQTTGELVSDDIATSKNDLGFGYYLQHQKITGDQFNYDPTTTPVTHDLIPRQEFGLGTSNFFLRDEFQASSATTAYLNAWSKRSTVTNKTTFDPRLSLVFRTSPSDVVRLTGGRSDGEPSPRYVQGIPLLNMTPQNITPACTGLTSVGNVSNKNLQPETSNDLELGYGHRFNADTIIQVDGYLSFEKNRIFSGNLPISATGAPIPAFLLAEYYQRIQQLCPAANPSLASLQVSTHYNAASTRYQGLELTGRHRFSPRVYADYSYNIQSVVNLAVPDKILTDNPTLINGSQLNQVPLHKASVGLDYSDNHGFELRTDVIYLSDNNSYNRPAFFYGNASLTKDLGRYATVNLGVQNVFDSQVSNIYAVGAANYTAENSFGKDTSALGQADAGNGGAETGLLQRQYTLSLTVRM